MSLFLLISVLISGFAAAGFASPIQIQLKSGHACLIVLMPKSREAPSTVAHFLAGEFDADGRVLPIVWSVSDPIFRSAIDSGIVPASEKFPSLDLARSIAEKLKCEFLIWIDEEKKEGTLIGTVQLYRVGEDKSIWKNSRNIAVTIANAVDWDNAARTHAHAWATFLFEGPFKKLKAAPRQDTPEPDPGQGHTDPTEVPVPPSDPIEKARKLIAEGHSSQAITVLRDAIDSNPSDMKLRRSLVDILFQLGLDEQAAIEAHRASSIAPDEYELRLSAVRGWLNANKPEEAQKEINELLARNSSGIDAQVLLGEVWLVQGQADKAFESFNQGADGKAKFEAIFGRALASAMLNRWAEAEKDLKSLAKPTPQQQIWSYRMAVRELDRSTDKVASDLRELIQRIRLAPKDPASVAAAESLKTRAETLSKLLNALEPPTAHKKSHLRRDLAQKLLAQAAGETLAFAKTGDEDTAGDAAISLGEALKQFPAVRQQYLAEQSAK